MSVGHLTVTSVQLVTILVIMECSRPQVTEIDDQLRQRGQKDIGTN
jgi:hypothetical protein